MLKPFIPNKAASPCPPKGKMYFHIFLFDFSSEATLGHSLALGTGTLEKKGTRQVRKV